MAVAPKIITDRIARMKKAMNTAESVTEKLDDLDGTTDAVTKTEKTKKAAKRRKDDIAESESDVVSLDAKDGGVIADADDETVAAADKPDKSVKSAKAAKSETDKKPALKKPPARKTAPKSAASKSGVSVAKKSNATAKTSTAKKSGTAKNGKKEG